MKRLILLACPLLALGLSSCVNTVYTTASNFQPISHEPPTLYEKGDVQVQAGYASFKSSNQYYWGAEEDLLYLNLGKRAAFLSIHGAVSDDFSFGLSYQYDTRFAARGHGLTGYATGFRNFEKRGTGFVGYDFTLGLSYFRGRNFMSVDSVFFDLYVLEPYLEDIYVNLDISPQGYYLIDQQDIRLFFQPSFTYENDFFEWHVGGSVGYHYRHEYDPAFLFENDLPDELEIHNPLLYYDRNRHFVFGEYFMSLGFGYEFIKVLFTAGAGHRNDPIQPNYGFARIGVRGRF